MQIPLFQSVNIEVSFVPELNAGERAPPVRSLDLGTGVRLLSICESHRENDKFESRLDFG